MKWSDYHLDGEFMRPEMTIQSVVSTEPSRRFEIRALFQLSSLFFWRVQYGGIFPGPFEGRTMSRIPLIST